MNVSRGVANAVPTGLVGEPSHPSVPQWGSIGYYRILQTFDYDGELNPQYNENPGSPFQPNGGLVIVDYPNYGTLYGTSDYGGDSSCLQYQGCGTAFGVTLSGKLIVLDEFGYENLRRFPIGGLLYWNSTFYGTTAGNIGQFPQLFQNPDTGGCIRQVSQPRHPIAITLPFPDQFQRRRTVCEFEPH